MTHPNELTDKERVLIKEALASLIPTLRQSGKTYTIFREYARLMNLLGVDVKMPEQLIQNRNM